MSLNILVVDDDQQARRRMRQLLSRCPGDLCGRVEEAPDAALAAGLMRHRHFDLLLLDIRMPGRQDGLALATTLRDMPLRPAVVFVTGYGEHALKAFDADAIDYLTKPVRADRLERALVKADGIRRQGLCSGPEDHEGVSIVSRRGAERLKLSDILYFRAEHKRVTAVTPRGSFVLDGALAELEQRFSPRLVRVHRHSLVPVDGITNLRRMDDDGRHNAIWTLGLRRTAERLPVARRMVAAVRERLFLQGD